MTQDPTTTTVPSPATAAPATAQPPARTAEPLDPVALAETVDLLVQHVRRNGCNDMAVAIAESIADSRAGGHAANVGVVLGRNMVITSPTGARTFDPRLDLDGDGIEKHELTSAVLTAAAIAATRGITVSDVTIDEEFLRLNTENCVKTQQGTTGQCR